MRLFLLTLVLLTIPCNVSSQTLGSVIPSEKTNFCDSTKGQNLIGTSAKIWHNGGIYEDLNKVKDFYFPTKEMRKKGGISGWRKFYPQNGDIGKIVYATEYTENAVGSAKIIYILQIKDKYVPIGCGYLTDTTKLDSDKESEKWAYEDSIRSVKYASGCSFKTSGINDCWNRAGLFKIDIISETFACNLKDSLGVDTILLCKYIFDNGSSPGEKAFLFWQQNGQGYLKAFFNNEKHIPTENKVVPIDWSDIYQYYFTNHIDTVTTDPKPSFWMSHSMGYSIQFYSTTTKYFCSRLQDYYWETDKSNHPKTKLWQLVNDKVKDIKQE
ncbi:MAG: hypothetical protein ACK5XV_09050 [Flavobacteriales bacterium]|jgi:hypothetical protein